MNDFTSVSDWWNNLMGNSGTTAANGVNVPTTPGMNGVGIGANNGANTFNTLGTSGLSGLQLGSLGLQAGSGLLNGYLGLQSLGLAKQQASDARNQWNQQWEANRTTTNAALNDRQAARVASNPKAYESVDSYMKKYGI